MKIRLRVCWHSGRGLLASAIFLFAGLAQMVGAAEATVNVPPPGLVTKSFTELNDLEVAADAGRRLYWQGKYQMAADLFERLNQENHVSKGLYAREQALCYLALGRLGDARRKLLDATAYLDTYNTPELEKRAGSKYGREAEKIYFGDPYEQATTWLLLALLFVNDRDYDNALAACKSGLLADSDAMGNRFQSDYTFLHLLEARCYQLRKQPDAAEPPLRLAKESYRSTHATVRDIFSERLDQIELLSLAPRERKQRGCRDDNAAIETHIRDLTRKLDLTAQSVRVDADLDGFANHAYNVLIVLPTGRAPHKYRAGIEGNLIKFTPGESNLGVDEIYLDGQPLVTGRSNEGITNVGAASEVRNVAVIDVNRSALGLADVSFQASTRGGRHMDAILKGEASFKHTTVSIGRSITEAGTQAGGLGGLAVALIGGIVQGAAGAVSAEADARCWRNLPAEYTVQPLNLSPGSHTVSFKRHLYFESLTNIEHSVRLTGEDELHVIFAPPTLMDRFSPQVTAASPGIKKRLAAVATTNNATAVPILLPPPLGLAAIEKFPSPDQKRLPRAFAPDPNRACRVGERSLGARGYAPLLVEHGELVANRAAAARKGPLALQFELAGLGLKMGEDAETYDVTFDFYLIQTQTGVSKWRRSIQGTWVKGRKDKLDPNEAFYHCLENSFDRLIKDPDFSSAVAGDQASNSRN